MNIRADFRKKVRHFSVSKYLLLVGVFLCIAFFSSTWQFGLGPLNAQSPDAIAIRVYPNDSHFSALRWYQSKQFTGSPQSLTVDGYEAVRDGQTVYVNAGNIAPNAAGLDRLYTNIYVITYNLAAEDATRDIFAQLLAHWSFNTNLAAGETWSGDPAACSLDGSKICLTDQDCKDKGYCQSAKAEVTRDTIRLARLYDIDALLKAYAARHGRYPALNAGSYLKNLTLSVWPSWQAVLSQELGVPLPVDPINKLTKTGDCAEDRFHPVTCWDEQAKEFAWAEEAKLATLPASNYVFLYKYGTTTNAGDYTLCAFSETGLFPDPAKMCNSGCVPACYGKECGPDGCGNECGDCGPGKSCANHRCFTGCATAPGCRASLARAHTVPGSCVAGACYECDEGTVWADPNCVCASTCNALGQPNCRNVAPAGATRAGGECCSANAACYECPTGTFWNGTACETGCAATCNALGQPNCQTSRPADTQSAAGTCCNTGEVCYQCKAGYSWDVGLSACVCAPLSLEPIANAAIYAVPSVPPPYYHGPTLFQTTAQASGGLNPVYSLSAAPAWLAISPQSGQIQGSHTAAGVFNGITVIARSSCGTTANQTFNLSVLANEWCGDGLWQAEHGEDCEAAGTGTGPADQWHCQDCEWSGGFCTDGVIQPEHGEICDDGNSSEADACSNACRPTFCGDGTIQTPNTAGQVEGCDNGASNGDVCVAQYNSTCPYCTEDCESAVVIGPSCGDGTVNGLELCDGANLGGGTCVGLGFGGGTLSCNALCQYNTANCCVSATCANLGKNCNSWPDGCGNTLNCGPWGINSQCLDGIFSCNANYKDCDGDRNCECFVNTENIGSPYCSGSNIAQDKVSTECNNVNMCVDTPFTELTACSFGCTGNPTDVPPAYCTPFSGYGTLCPFVLVWNGQEYIDLGTFLVGADSVDKKKTIFKDMKGIELNHNPSILIKEIEPESSKIDMLMIKITLKSGWPVYLKPIRVSRNLSEILAVDNLSLTMMQGDEVIVEFEPLYPLYSSLVDQVGLLANGYYDIYPGYSHDPATGKIIESSD